MNLDITEIKQRINSLESVLNEAKQNQSKAEKMSDPIKDKFRASLRSGLNETKEEREDYINGKLFFTTPEDIAKIDAAQTKEPNISALVDKVFGTKMGERLFRKFVKDGNIALRQEDIESMAGRFLKAMATEMADTIDQAPRVNTLGYYPDAKPRPAIDEWALSIALSAKIRSTCLSRQVGCVLFDSMNHVIGMGYNGSARGMAQCSDNNVCLKRAIGYGSGEGDEYCPAIHAEQNALVQCSDPYKIHTVYVTTSPCHTCTKMLLSTSAQRIVFLDEYTGLSGSCAKDMWLKAGREWIKFDYA